jgi:hypothetical protein
MKEQTAAAKQPFFDIRCFVVDKKGFTFRAAN